ncbi:hypothetical protein ABTZ21_34375 [Streptomyces sp. NPDC096191]|uniref:hypothetical protein n=1 Tax=Streptomyces sp. NPDC096191 TaxID=3155426 RepID=UPI0033246EE3
MTSIEVGDPYLVDAARDRLATIGLHPTVEAVDGTGPRPGKFGQFDRIVATVAVRTVPVGWLAGLRTGGRLVTSIAGTSLIITAEKRADGVAVGRVAWDLTAAAPPPARAGVLPGGPLLGCRSVTGRQTCESVRVLCRAASPSA